MVASAFCTLAENGATFLAVISTLRVMLSDVAETQFPVACLSSSNKMDALGVVVEQLNGNAHRIVKLELAQITYMRFDHHGRMFGAFEIGGAEAEEFVDFVHRAVEKHMVIGDVEMAIVVDPLRFNLHDRGDEGRRHFWFDAIQHYESFRLRTI